MRYHICGLERHLVANHAQTVCFKSKKQGHIVKEMVYLALTQMESMYWCFLCFKLSLLKWRNLLILKDLLLPLRTAFS